jgi:hypothetical protein
MVKNALDPKMLGNTIRSTETMGYGIGADDVGFDEVYDLLLVLGLDEIGGLHAVAEHRSRLLKRAVEMAPAMYRWEFIRVIDAIAYSKAFNGPAPL